jgi:hypothetical protein
MDRPVSAEHKKKLLIKQVGYASLVVIVPVAIILFLKSVFIPSVSLSRVTTALSEYGEIQITVQGAGNVILRFEATS